MAVTPSTICGFTAARPSAGPTRSSPTPPPNLVLHGQRFTLAVIPVTRSESIKQVLKELLAAVSKAGVKIGLLLLDRGFYSVEVIRYLQQAGRPFLMPVVCHGRKADHPLGPSGSNVFKAMTRSGWSSHTLQDGVKNKATVGIWVKRVRYKNKHGKRKSETYVYAFWGIAPKDANWVKRTYRRRFRVRDELSPNEPVPHPHDDQEVQRPVL